MKRTLRISFTLIFLVMISCNSGKNEKFDLEIKPLITGITNSLRGLSVVDENVVWASGTAGIFLITNDGGLHWKIDSVPGAARLDFRSIKAFDDKTAFVASAGTPATIYKTTDGGITWKEKFRSNDPAIFFDAIVFWDEKTGIVMGDPVDRHLFLLKTTDGGENWNRINPRKIPESREVEGGFAASGTCMAIQDTQNAWIGTGGEKAGIYYSSDKGESWQWVETPLLCGSTMRGIYSVAFKNRLEGIAAGGEWNVEKPSKSRAFTTDGGLTWTLGSGVDSYCSGSCYVGDNVFLTCGQSGIDLSTDGGKNWKNIDKTNLHGIAFCKTGKTGYASGENGLLLKLYLR